MVGTNATLIAIRLVRSKLRKRDGDNRHNNAVNHRHAQILQSTPTVQHQNNVNNNHLHHNNSNGTPSPTSANGGTTIPTVSSTVIYPPPVLQTIPSAADIPANSPRQFLWQIPATHSYALYSNDKETLVHPLASEQPGFCRGFRKNLQGRWKRLVKRKPINESYAIPPELRDQLKNIYVY